MESGSLTGFTVRLDDDGILWITFDEPARLNALTRAAKRDLIETLLQAQMETAVKVVVFTGTGRAFVAGDDLNRDRQASESPSLVPPLHYGSPSAEVTYASLRTTSQMLNRVIRHLDKVTIAAVNGHAVQSGLSLALACDFKIAAHGARLGSATLRYGFLPDEGGHYLLLQHLGLARTLEFLLRNRMVDAEEALAMGLVNEVVPPEELLARAGELARELAQGPQLATRLLKRAVYNAASSTFEEALEDIATKTAISDYDPDAAEGRTAFREHRAPRFRDPAGPGQ